MTMISIGEWRRQHPEVLRGAAGRAAIEAAIARGECERKPSPPYLGHSARIAEERALYEEEEKE